MKRPPQLSAMVTTFTHIDFLHIIDISTSTVKVEVDATADGRDWNDSCIIFSIDLHASNKVRLHEQ